MEGRSRAAGVPPGEAGVEPRAPLARERSRAQQGGLREGTRVAPDRVIRVAPGGDARLDLDEQIVVIDAVARHIAPALVLEEVMRPTEAVEHHGRRQGAARAPDHLE